MSVSLTLEVSQPRGTKFRLGLRCNLHLLISAFVAFSRLF
jgi:hypothetical protein